MDIYKIDIEDIDGDYQTVNNKISVGCKNIRQVGDTTLIADDVIIVIQGTIKSIEKTMEE